MLFFALLALAGAAPAKESLDARLHALSKKIHKESLPECLEEHAQCKDFCHSNGISWEAKCDTDYHCCAGCPRCLATANLLPESFMMASKASSDYCVHVEGGSLGNFVNLVWGSGCGHAAVKFSALDTGDGNFVLHVTSDNEEQGDSTYCVHPHSDDGEGTITNGMALVTYDECETSRANMQFSPIWDGENFMLQSVADESFCVHNLDNDSVSDDVQLVFKKGCGDSAAKFTSMAAP
jgi:hypothetical protein